MKLRKIVEKKSIIQEKIRWVRYWCQDESRFGLKTIQRRCLTLKGVKPRKKVQWQRENFYLYGVVEPLSGESFFWEFNNTDTICFQKFLEIFSEKFPLDLHIIQLDNAKFHSSEFLQIPSNIILLYQPPHCPEVNPIERLWEQLKEKLKWELFKNLEDLRKNLEKILNNLTQYEIACLTGWDFIIEALYVTGI